MGRVDPLPREALTEHEPALQIVEQVMGFVLSSMPTMARVPGLMEGFMGMAAAVTGNPLIPNELKQMIALMTSVGSGCRYCQAHTGHTAERMGVSEEKLASIWEFETSEHFSEAERSALRIAFHAGQSPNQVTDEHFAAAKEHWTDDQMAAIVAVIAMFGYLNRWNDTMATSLEESPNSFGERVLSGGGWERGKHV
ncbi:MAG: carboxymuconolactone decarboxylase family protein [Actinomycetota bacterium]